MTPAGLLFLGCLLLIVFDAYTEFFMFKSGRSIIPLHIRVFNKPGWFYGFLTNVAYVADYKNKIEFFISGTIYCKSDGVLNDDRYEYNQTGYPFSKECGNIICNYELARRRKCAGPGQVQINICELILRRNFVSIN